jgi:hypothetical protein
MPSVDELFRAAIDAAVSKLEAGEMPDRVFAITNKYGITEVRRFPVVLDGWFAEQVSKVTPYTETESSDNFNKLLWGWLQEASAAEAIRAGAQRHFVSAQSVNQAVNRIRRSFNMACESERKRLISQVSGAE